MLIYGMPVDGRATSVGRREDYEVVLSRTFDGGARNSMIERDEAACPLDGKTEQINVRQLPAAVNRLRVEQPLIE